MLRVDDDLVMDEDDDILLSVSGQVANLDAVGLAASPASLEELLLEDPELQGVFRNLAAMERDRKFKMEQSFVKVAYPEVW